MNYLEHMGTLFSILYIIFIIKEKKIAWIFSFISSIIISSIYLSMGIYLQASLNFYYAMFAIYGYLLWSKKEPLIVHDIKLKTHIYLIATGILFVFLLYWINAKLYISSLIIPDAIIFIFSLLATYLQAQKILSNWLYWIVLNLFSAIIMYNIKLYYIMLLMVSYTILAIIGYIKWKKLFVK